jgi:hypothetical protein
MQDQIAKALTWLADQRTEHLAEDLEYCAGVDQFPFRGTVGRTELEITDSNGLTTIYTSVDFMMRPCDLLINGRRSKPQIGHTIRRTLDGVTNVYETLPPPGKQNYRDADPHRKTYRIHTKLIGSEPV